MFEKLEALKPEPKALETFREAFILCSNEKAVPYRPTKKRKLITLDDLEAEMEASRCVSDDTSPIIRSLGCPLVPVRFWTDRAKCQNVERKLCLTELHRWMRKGVVMAVHVPSFPDFKVVTFTDLIVESWRSAVDLEYQRWERTEGSDAPPSREDTDNAVKAWANWICSGQEPKLSLSDFVAMGIEWKSPLDTFLFNAAVIIARGPKSFYLIIPHIGLLSSVLKHHTQSIVTNLSGARNKELTTADLQKRILQHSKIPTEVKQTPMKWALAYLADQNKIRSSFQFDSKEVISLQSS